MSFCSNLVKQIKDLIFKVTRLRRISTIREINVSTFYSLNVFPNRKGLAEKFHQFFDFLKKLPSAMFGRARRPGLRS